MNQAIKENNFLFGLLFVAAIFLLTGTLHDYPYILHPDEPTTVKTALAQRFRFGVDRFDWGHLGFYLQYFLFEIFIKARVVFNLLGLENLLKSNFNLLYQDNFIFYALARFSTQVMSLVTVLYVYKICRLFFSKLSSLIATAFLVISPYFIYLSHFAVQDPPQLFFLTLSLYYFLRKSFTESKSGLILSSVFLACAASYKFNVLFFIPFFYVANFLIVNKVGLIKKFISIENIKLVLIWTLTFLIVFFGIHYTIFADWDTFWSLKPSYGFLWQIQVNSGSRLDYNIQTIVPEFISHIFRMFSPIAGTVVILSILYLLINIARKIYGKDYSKQDLILYLLIISATIFTAIMMKSGKYRIHYLFPLYPFLIISVAYLIENFRKVSKYIYLLFLVYPFYLSVVQAIEMNRLSTTSIVVTEMLEGGSNNYFYKSDDIHNVKLWNYIDGIHSIDGSRQIMQGDIFVTDSKLENTEGFELIKVQDSDFRMGNVYYFYKKI